VGERRKSNCRQRVLKGNDKKKTKAADLLLDEKNKEAYNLRARGGGKLNHPQAKFAMLRTLPVKRKRISQRKPQENEVSETLLGGRRRLKEGGEKRKKKE